MQSNSQNVSCAKIVRLGGASNVKVHFILFYFLVLVCMQSGRLEIRIMYFTSVYCTLGPNYIYL